MRVTERMRWTRTQRQLETTSSKGDEAAQRALTGKRVQVASDDVSAFNASERLKAHSGRQQAYMKNAEHVQMELDRADSAVGQAHDLMSRARELSVQFGDASYGADEMQGGSLEVDALREALARVANTEHVDRGLFSGIDSRAKVMDDTGVYQGSSGQRAVSIGKGVEVELQTAEDVFGPQGSSAFEALEAFSAALSSGDGQAVRAAQAGLDDALERLESAHQRVGTDLQKTGEAMTFADNMSFLNETQAADITEADFAEAVSTMQQQSTLYELSMKIASEQKQLTRSILSL